MGIAKHYYTLKMAGRRIDAATKRFFEDKSQEQEVAAKKEEQSSKKEETVGDILQNLLDEDK